MVAEEREKIISMNCLTKTGTKPKINWLVLLHVGTVEVRVILVPTILEASKHNQTKQILIKIIVCDDDGDWSNRRNMFPDTQFGFHNKYDTL